MALLFPTWLWPLSRLLPIPCPMHCGVGGPSSEQCPVMLRLGDTSVPSSQPVRWLEEMGAVREGLMGQNWGGGAQRLNGGSKMRTLWGARPLQKVVLSGIDAGVSHCWEGLELLMLGRGRWWESLALPTGSQFTQLHVAHWKA